MDRIFESDIMTVIKLSHRKIMVSYRIPMFHDGCSDAFDWIDIKIRYNWSQSDQIFNILFPKAGFYSKLSNHLRIKKKNIRTDFLGGNIWSVSDQGIKTVNVDNPFQPGSPIRLMRFIVSLTMTDKTWSRDYKINSII